MKRPGIIYVRLEDAMIRAALRQLVEQASDQAGSLARIGETALAGIMDLMFDCDANELQARATRLRSAALHAAYVAVELQAHATSLAMLAWIREAGEIVDP